MLEMIAVLIFASLSISLFLLPVILLFEDK